MSARQYFCVKGKVECIDEVCGIQMKEAKFRNLIVNGSYIHMTIGAETEGLVVGNEVLVSCYIDIPETREGSTYVVGVGLMVIGKRTQKEREDNE